MLVPKIIAGTLNNSCSPVQHHGRIYTEAGKGSAPVELIKSHFLYGKLFYQLEFKWYLNNDNGRMIISSDHIWISSICHSIDQELICIAGRNFRAGRGESLPHWRIKRIDLINNPDRWQIPVMVEELNIRSGMSCHACSNSIPRSQWNINYGLLRYTAILYAVC